MTGSKNVSFGEKSTLRGNQGGRLFGSPPLLSHPANRFWHPLTVEVCVILTVIFCAVKYGLYTRGEPASSVTRTLTGNPASLTWTGMSPDGSAVQHCVHLTVGQFSPLRFFTPRRYNLMHAISCQIPPQVTRCRWALGLWSLARSKMVHVV